MPESPRGSQVVETGSWGWNPSLASVAQPQVGDEVSVLNCESWAGRSTGSAPPFRRALRPYFRDSASPVLAGGGLHLAAPRASSAGALPVREHWPLLRGLDARRHAQFPLAGVASAPGVRCRSRRSPQRHRSAQASA
eukprot:2694985-Alexandrium_andersonii.AAC.1